jgi:hypothetical protein
VWVSAPVNGLVFALAMAGGHLLFDATSWSSALVRGGMGGLVFGALMAPVLYRQRRRLLAATAGLPEGQIASAARASIRGPVPADPLVRAAAARLSAQQGALLERQRLWGTPFFGVLTAVTVWLAVTDSPIWWAALPVFGVLLWFQLLGPRRFRRRAQLLGASATSD